MRIFLAATATLCMMLLTMATQAKAANSAVQKCIVQPEGLYNGSWVRHRIVVDDDAVYGSDDMEQIISQLSVLRNQGFCR